MISAILKPVQAPFAEKIEREFCQSSAIAPALYRANIEIIEDRGLWEPNRALNQHVSRFWETARPHSFGAIAMFQQEDGTYWQGKPQNPRIDRAKGKAIKYEAIAGSGSRAYLPAIDPETREAIARRHSVEVPTDGSFWQWLEQHPEIPVIVTEGGKKSLALLSLGYVAIALIGVNGGYRSNGRIGGEVIPLEKPELIADLTRFSVPGRPISLAFDQDTKAQTRAKVAGALFKFGALLKATGSNVGIASWEPAQGKGIDDLIVNCGAAAAGAAIEEAITFSQWTIGRQMGQRVKRKADLNIGDREFVEVVGELPTDQDIAFYGGKGTSKSKAIAQLLDGESWLSATLLKSLAREQAESWGGAFINDGDRYGNKFLKDGRPVNGGSVCVPSLMKVRAIDADVLVIDETTAVLEFLLISKLANKDGIRPLLLTEFERRVRETKCLIIADADMTEEALCYLEAIRGTRFFLVRSERKPLQWTANLIETRKEAIAELLDRAENLPDGQVLYANFDEKSAANALATVLEAKGIKSLLITQDTSGGDVERSFLASKGRDIPALYQAGIRAIITSPSVTQGFSIEHNTAWIDSAWGIYAGTTISAAAIAQALDRVRAPIPRYLFIPERGRAYSKLSGALNQKDFTREFKSASSAVARLAKNSLKPETNAAVDGIDWQSENIKLLAALEVSRNKGMVALRDTVCALLRQEGKAISPYKTKLSRKAVKDAGKAIFEAGKAAEEARQIAIAGSETLDEQQAAELEKKARSGLLTQAELHSLEKYYLARFYRLGTVEVSDVEFDSRGRTRKQVRNLEALLDPAIAHSRAANPIERNTSTPQDWDRIGLLIWLAEQSGLADLIRGVLSGEVAELEDADVSRIAGYMRQHPRELKLAGGHTISEKTSNQEIVGRCLELFGIKTKRKQRRCGEEIHSEYLINQERLEKLKAILQRRAAPVTPSGELDQIEPGVTAQNPDDLESLRSMLGVADTPEAAQSVKQVAISLGLHPNPALWPCPIAA